MKRSTEMKSLLSLGYIYVHSMDEVVKLQDESIFEGILIDYQQVLVKDSPIQTFKVYQLGGEE